MSPFKGLTRCGCVDWPLLAQSDKKACEFRWYTDWFQWESFYEARHEMNVHFVKLIKALGFYGWWVGLAVTINGGQNHNCCVSTTDVRELSVRFGNAIFVGEWQNTRHWMIGLFLAHAYNQAYSELYYAIQLRLICIPQAGMFQF